MACHSDKVKTNASVLGPDEASHATYMTESLVEIEENPNFLGRLTERDRIRVIERGYRRAFGVGEHFFHQGEPHDGIHVIQSGRVRSYYTSPSGREITLAYWTPGHFVGGSQICGGGCHMWSSVAVTQSSTLWIAGEELRGTIPEVPDLALAVIDGLVHKGKCYAALLQLIGTRQMRARLAHLLLTLAERHGVTDSEGDLVVEVRFTHEELSAMIGATRQWVSATLEQFERDSLVIRKTDRIAIVDKSSLAQRSC